MGFGPGSKGFAAYEQGGSDFRLAAALGREFKNAFAIDAIVKRWAPAVTRGQDFEIGARGTSQDVAEKFAEGRSALPEGIPDVQAIGLAQFDAFLRLYEFIGQVTVRLQAATLNRAGLAGFLPKNTLKCVVTRMAHL